MQEQRNRAEEEKGKEKKRRTGRGEGEEDKEKRRRKDDCESESESEVEWSGVNGSVAGVVVWRFEQLQWTATARTDDRCSRVRHASRWTRE